MRSLYVHFIRSLLEFAVPVWSNALKCDLNILGKAQHRATRLIASLKSYEERLKALDLAAREKTERRYDSNLQNLS